MHATSLTRRLLLPPALLASSIFFAGTAMLGAPATAAAAPQVLAEAPRAVTSAVTDTAGVLSADEQTALEGAIRDFEASSNLKIAVVYVKSFDGLSGQQWAKQALQKTGSNTALLAIATEDRLYGIEAAQAWDTSLVRSMDQAAQARLRQSDFAGAGMAFVEQAQGSRGGGSSSSGSSGSGGSGLLWLGLGGAALLGAGGAAKAMSSKKKKRDTQAALARGRELPAAQAQELGDQPIEVLQTLADEELVSTDESIRKAKEELSIATAEFGAERTRSFTRAMNTSTTTLQRAFRWKQQLVQGEVSPAERRTLLLQIIAECRKADEALDEQAADFAAMRNLLVNAESRLTELTQRSITLRARTEQASGILGDLQSKYDSVVLQSLDDNIPLANAALDQAEKLIDEGHAAAKKPVGQQGGAVEAIRASEDALNQADKQLQAIEQADNNLQAARTQLPALVREVEQELQEAAGLEQQAQQQGTKVDWDAFHNSVNAAKTALEYHRSHPADPLSSWTQLTEADAQLDEQLDALRLSNTDQSRVLQVAQQQFAAADAAIQGAAGFIQARGRVVGPEARARLAEAERSRALAQQALRDDARAAVEHARQARALADDAQRLANEDMRRYQNRNNRGGGGDFITGMVLGQILGGGNGGFGGGFGGGSFGGGGFSGGGSFGGGYSGGGSF